MANYTLDYTGAEVNGLLEKIDTAFGEETTMRDSITWDGDTDGLYNALGMFYKVSSATPTLEELRQGGSLVFGGNEIPFTSSNALDVSVAGMGNNAILILNGSDPLAGVVLKAGATVTMQGMTATFDEAGIYFMYNAQYGVYTSSLTINNYTFVETDIKTIDEKFLPKSVEIVNIVPSADGESMVADKTFAEIKSIASQGVYVVACENLYGTLVYATLSRIKEDEILFGAVVGDKTFRLTITSDNTITSITN